MSAIELLKDVFTGNFTSAKQRLENWASTDGDKIIKRITSMFAKLGKDELTLAETIFAAKAKDLFASGNLSSANIIAAALAAGSELASQGVTLFFTEVFTGVNSAIMDEAAAQGVALPTNTGTNLVPATA